ncbi:MAG: hypothetical protein WCG47_11485 [Dermatophilaceae bacterium]
MSPDILAYRPPAAVVRDLVDHAGLAHPELVEGWDSRREGDARRALYEAALVDLVNATLSTQEATSRLGIDPTGLSHRAVRGDPARACG